VSPAFAQLGARGRRTQEFGSSWSGRRSCPSLGSRRRLPADYISKSLQEVGTFGSFGPRIVPQGQGIYRIPPFPRCPYLFSFFFPVILHEEHFVCNLVPRNSRSHLSHVFRFKFSPWGVTTDLVLRRFENSGTFFMDCSCTDNMRRQTERIIPVWLCHCS
jgi:hypothetical protein